jgi:hypothetical protein
MPGCQCNPIERHSLGSPVLPLSRFRYTPLAKVGQQVDDNFRLLTVF